MKKTALLLAAGLVTSMTAGPSLAMSHGECHGGKGWMPPIEQMDTDKNGSISTAEMNAFHQKHFTEADTNKDGSLDAKEFQTMHEKKRAKRMEEKFKRMDSDGNGKLSQEELSNKKHMGMKQCDKDANGELSKAELEACQPRMHERMQKEHGMNTGGTQPNTHGTPPPR